MICVYNTHPYNNSLYYNTISYVSYYEAGGVYKF